MATPYDDVPYANLPFAQTRPSVLATVAALHGLEAPDPRAARVLELGCGAGANLAGIAAAHPDVRVVGVDLAPTAIAAAREIAAAAGLANASFDVADVMELVDGRLGEFDYVIVHGLYAWGDAALREATLATCHAHLAPTGLAYVSYTAHPGGHLRRMLREMALWHARGASDPRARAARARELFALLDRLAESEGPSFYSGGPGEEIRALANGPEEMLVHDLLGAHYEPVWLTDFAAAAARAGLVHVADALLESSRRPPWTEQVEAFVAAASGGDRIAREQYFDILVLRRFRQSLLARAGREPTGPVDRSAIPRLLVAEGSAPPVPFEALGRDVDAVLEAFDDGRVSFHVVPPVAAPIAGPRPRASALARSQARPGALLTTLRNQVVRVNDEQTARLLTLLDGTRDRDALARELPGPPENIEAALAGFAAAGLLHE